MYENALTISELENIIYEFFRGVLPQFVDTDILNTGFSVRFTGYITQKHPAHIDIFSRNHCYIKAEKITPILRYEPDKDGISVQEVEFVYSIELNSKQTNFLENSALSNALKLTAHRDGYELFQKVGISSFEIINQNIKTTRQNVFFSVLMTLTLRALIKSNEVKQTNKAISAGIVILEKDSKVYEVREESKK